MSAERDSAALVLVAEDSLVVRTILHRQLEEYGHRVIEAADGEEALAMCRKHHPDVILLDVEMPKLDGHGVLTVLRESPDLADIPVVFLTARATTDDVVEGLRLGAHDYLRKPFEPAELLARVSAAVRVKILQDQLRQRNIELSVMSRTDALTGLPNRREMHDRMVAAASAAHRHDQPSALLMVDIDHFKNVNDTRGHEGGDVVLRAVADRLNAACRAEDLAGRWGGEEFLVVAPTTDLDGASQLGERIRSHIGDTAVPMTVGPDIRVTVSVGVASGIRNAEVLLAEADAALYAAKRDGRNRVALGQEEI
ncbi:MAG: two-component system, cell cycle response regulator [Actinomycetota bacterium]|jgi:diguanylate cyclase (GGDEF)-like protein|nr:two-component system, cell cycle response regulator [Actinomycetota bacterium]